MDLKKFFTLACVFSISAFVFTACSDDDGGSGVLDDATSAVDGAADDVADAADDAADSASDAADDAAQRSSDNSSSDDSSSDDSSSAEPAAASSGGGGGFVWKPVSEGDGNLVVLLPPGASDSALTANGQSGRNVGRTNGNRPTFRFSSPGCNFGGGVSVRGNAGFSRTIANGCSRQEG